MKDISQVAGLSMQAVSRALRNMPEIRQKTKDKVAKIALDLGYIKNDTAATLKSGNSKLVAVIYDNIINPYFSIMTAYLHSQLKLFGYSIIIGVCENTCFEKNDFVGILSKGVDGIITFIEPTIEVEKLIEQHKIPLILIGRKSSNKKIDFLDTDDNSGGIIATKRLISQGCKNLLYLSESLTITCAKERFNGFSQCAKEHDVNYQCITIDNFDVAHTLGQIQDMQSLDGIFCFNDIIAFDTINYLQQNNLSHIKVIGYDDVWHDIHFPYRLTTIGYDKKQMAKIAIDVLVYKMQNATKLPRVFQKLHSVYLVEGQSG